MTNENKPTDPALEKSPENLPEGKPESKAVSSEPKAEQVNNTAPAQPPAVSKEGKPESKAVSAEVKEEQTNCPVCNKHLKKIKKYYRNNKYFCSKNCWLKLAKKTTEAKSAA